MDSNHRPSGFEPDQLPLLSPRMYDLICASGRARTCNLLVRSEILFPIELPKHWSGISWSRTIFSGFSVLRIHQVCQDSNVRKQKDSNLRNPCGVRPLSRGLVSTAHPCFHFGQSQRTSNIIFWLTMQSYDGVMHSICVTKKLCKKYEIFYLGILNFSSVSSDTPGSDATTARFNRKNSHLYSYL